jgi:hypothetical protein
MNFIVGFVDLIIVKKNNLYLEGWCFNKTTKKIPLYFKIIYQKKILKKKLIRFKRFDVAKNLKENSNIKFGFKIMILSKINIKNFSLSKLKFFVVHKNYKVRLPLSK